MANYLNRLKRLEAKIRQQPTKQTIMTFIEENESQEDAQLRWVNQNVLTSIPNADWIFIQWISPN